MDNAQKINWAAMETGSGDGTGRIIPSLIDQLRSTDPQTRSNASEALSAHLIHQGNTYEPAVFVIPMLLEMLRDDNFLDKFLALEVLEDLPGVFLPAELMVTESFRADINTAYESLFMNLAAGTDVYRNLLDADEQRTRKSALGLFIDFCPPTSESAEILVERCKTEVDIEIRVFAIRFLGILLADKRFQRAEMAPFVSFLNSLTTSETAAVRTEAQEALERCGQTCDR
ncbi:MAG TPA: hypothetical protein PLQ56_06795 [Aggregatilineales bacterium]|nr:hypothetical protein [Aggregatilineales bacterium]